LNPLTYLFVEICRALRVIYAMKPRDRNLALTQSALLALQEQAIAIAATIPGGYDRFHALIASMDTDIEVIEAFAITPDAQCEIVLTKNEMDKTAKTIDPAHMRALETRGLSLHALRSRLLLRAIHKNEKPLQDWLVSNEQGYERSIKLICFISPKNVAMAPDFIDAYLKSSVAQNPALAGRILEEAAQQRNGFQYTLLRMAGALPVADTAPAAGRRIEDLSAHRLLPVLRHGTDLAAFCVDPEAILSAQKLFE